MNVDTLIPGDIVYAKIENSYDGDCIELPVVIERVFDNTVRCRAYEDKKTLYHVIPRSLISPIPLTKKLLKKNGYIEEKGLWLYEDEDKGIKMTIGLNGEYPYDGMGVTVDWGTENVNDYYLPSPLNIHDLQRNYRICRLDNLINNIKL